MLMDTTRFSRKSNTTSDLHSGATRPARGRCSAGQLRAVQRKSWTHCAGPMARLGYRPCIQQQRKRRPEKGSRHTRQAEVLLHPPALAASTCSGMSQPRSYSGHGKHMPLSGWHAD